MLRLELIEAEKWNWLLVDIHHSIGDGVTLAPNMTIYDIPAAYNGDALEETPYGMYEYAEDEQASFGTENYERAAQYYKEKFAGIDFVTLAGNPDSHLGNMVRESAFMPVDEVDKWCAENGTSSNLLYMAAFSLVMSRFSREKQVAYYSVNHGRMDKRLARAYGMFVKSVPILADVNPEEKVIDYIKGFRRELMSTIRYGVYPFNHFCRDLGVKPMVSFGFQGYAMQEYFELEGERCTSVQLPKGKIDDDMSCVIYLRNGQYDIRMESSDALNSKETLRTVADAVKHATEYMMAHPEARLDEIELLSSEEQATIAAQSQGRQVTIDSTQTFPSLFMAQAAKTPSALAVVDEKGSYTYEKLNAITGALASRLLEMGVEKNHFVSIMLGYQKEFVVAALGVEKCGGAYVPLDYDYPNDRLLYMLEDSESQVLITSHPIFNEKNAEGEFSAKNILFIDDFLTEVSADSGSPADQTNFATPDSLAYMIYTSGSTGKPKGVMIPHRAKANFVQFIAREWGHTQKSHICCHSSFSFDASIEDLYPVLTVGGTLYTVPQEARKDMELLHDFILKNGITGGCYTTQLGQLLLQMYPDLPVDYLVVGGEKMTANPDCRCRLINTYGPTEFTVDATFFELKKDREYKNIPIGRPLDNLAAYVVDAAGHLLPLGMAGELCMAGAQMAAGYWKREDLTTEKFSDLKIQGDIAQRLNEKIAATNDRYEKMENVFRSLDETEQNINSVSAKMDIINKSFTDYSHRADSFNQKLIDLDSRQETYKKKFESFEKESKLILQSEKDINDVRDQFKQLDILHDSLLRKTDEARRLETKVNEAMAKYAKIDMETDEKITILQALLKDANDTPAMKSVMSGDEERSKVIVQMKKQGMTIDEISNILHISRQEVEMELGLNDDNSRRAF